MHPLPHYCLTNEENPFTNNRTPHKSANQLSASTHISANAVHVAVDYKYEHRRGVVGDPLRDRAPLVAHVGDAVCKALIAVDGLQEKVHALRKPVG